MPPRLFSRRFRIVLQLALSAAPRRAMAALRCFVGGKRVRGWNLLCGIAAENPDYYGRWIAEAEPGYINAWLARNTSTSIEAPKITAIIVSAQSTADLNRTQSSILKAFDPASTIAIVSADGCDWSQLIAILRSTASAWIMPIVAGDILSPFVGAAVARASPETASIYWDEDHLDQGTRRCAWAKPEWDPVLYANRGGLLGASLLHVDAALVECERLSANAQENRPAAALLADLCLAVASRSASHVPLILTHRALPPVPAAPKQEPYPLRWPLVSIIIPTRDLPDHLSSCLRGLSLLDYPGEIETILVDNGSTDLQALDLLASQEAQAGKRVLRMPGPFNFSKLNNEAVRIARGEILCFLNNDVEPLDGEWLSKLVSQAVQPEVGAVGAMLLYPDGTIQHAGVAIGIGGAAGHVEKGTMPDRMREDGWYIDTRRVSAVTAACLVVNKQKFLSVEGFDEDAFPVAFNDVDLCLKLQRMGLHNLFVAEARLIHYESKSRGHDDNPEKRKRFAGELERLRRRWQTRDYLDPWHSPLFSRASERCLLHI